jgi:hypothetical protein
MERIAMSQEESDKLEWLKGARDRLISRRVGRRWPNSMMTAALAGPVDSILDGSDEILCQV